MGAQTTYRQCEPDARLRPAPPRCIRALRSVQNGAETEVSSRECAV